MIRTPNLPALEADEVHLADSITILQQLQNMALDRKDVDHVLTLIKAIIDKELPANSPKGDRDTSCMYFNQVTVNMAFRLYYQLLHKHNMDDQHFRSYVQANDAEVNFTILYFVLLTGQSHYLEPEVLKDKCLLYFAKAVDNNDSNLLTIIKTLNLIFKKWPHLDVGSELSLDHVYFCLQSNQQGMRDEMLTLMQHVCLCRTRSLEYFIRVVNFWPWTYRNKLYMLVCILNKHSLKDLLKESGYSGREFFGGLRSTLNYKNLLPSSQHVIKALSAQRSEALLEMCAEILSNGSLQEIRNLYAQWFSRIQQKEELFLLVWERVDMKDIFANATFYHRDPVRNYRIILICSMFAKEILQSSLQSFCQLSEELLQNWYKYELESQLLVYKFVVDNLSNLELTNCLEFFTDFSRKHKTVENSLFRNTVLGKIPMIINHVAKIYSKLSSQGETSVIMESKILIFFQNMQNDIDDGIANTIYQPKIFCLKLLEILMHSLYAENVTKNSKNCSLSQNQNLAKFLKQHKVFDGAQVSQKLMSLLNDPTGFDDALNLIVKLIGCVIPKDVETRATIVNQSFEMSVQSCSLSDVDESNLSSLYARVAVENCSNDTQILNLFQEILDGVKTRLHSFEEDPLWACKSKGWHLFSSLNVLNEVVKSKHKLCLDYFMEMLQTIEEIEKCILRMINICNSPDKVEVCVAASFEDMDKSLEILVSNSEWPSEDHENSRKYLLMSFWLTLKACCDLSASMGQSIVTSETMIGTRLHFLERCLAVSVTVLTKCRHKGAIEAAGITIGQLTKCITSHLPTESQEYELLHKCLQHLYDTNGKREVSTTRRGAGFAIMFLHIVKNEEHRIRPILKKALRNLLKTSETKDNHINSKHTKYNCDRIEALHLHYLCVLVRDTELREAMSKYYNEIMMTALTHIDNPEWTICNAALQLWGALVPKIVGQRQATEFEETLLWEPSEVTFCEVTRKLNMSYEFILNYCLGDKSATGSIILFLEFLHKVEYIHKAETEAPKSVKDFRHLMWCLLRHPCEKVRKLAAKCFVRSHEFSHELPNALTQIAKILFEVKNENFIEGLIQTLTQGILKLQHDLKYVKTEENQRGYLLEVKDTLENNFSSFKYQSNYYILCKLWDLLQLLTFDGEESSSIITELRKLTLQDKADFAIAYDLWTQRIR